MGLREIQERLEDERLHPLAARSSRSRGREREEEKCPVRTEFQRDRDRILHSKAFRRLAHKTQVFLHPEGDHYRTRLTHTLEVMQIARTIARALHLNEDLAEAAALGHDLGHTPFGHAGERVLARITGDFHHARQSLRVVDVVENDGKGLNLTWEVRDAILRHSKGRGPILTEDPEVLPSTLEGQIVRISDIIAYVNHDFDDGVRAGLIAPDALPRSITSVLGNTRRERIGNLVLAVIQGTDLDRRPLISMERSAYDALVAMRDFLYEHVYEHPSLLEEFEKCYRVIYDLWDYYKAHPEEIPGGERPHYTLVDYISGMTDRYALKKWDEIRVPKPWPVE